MNQLFVKFHKQTCLYMLQRKRHEMELVGLFVGSLLQSKAAIDKRLANETRVPRRVLNLFSANQTIDRHK